MSCALNTLVERAVDELRDWSHAHPQGALVDEKIFAIADSHVPVYSADLLRLASEDLALAVTVPEFGPACDGDATPVNIIAANVFAHLERELWDAWHYQIHDEENV